jgi:hypothetical protein
MSNVVTQLGNDIVEIYLSTCIRYPNLESEWTTTQGRTYFNQRIEAGDNYQGS